MQLVRRMRTWVTYCANQKLLDETHPFTKSPEQVYKSHFPVEKLNFWIGVASMCHEHYKKLLGGPARRFSVI